VAGRRGERGKRREESRKRIVYQSKLHYFYYRLKELLKYPQKLLLVFQVLPFL
jgi:hypothetical protein